MSEKRRGRRQSILENRERHQQKETRKDNRRLDAMAMDNHSNQWQTLQSLIEEQLQTVADEKKGSRKQPRPKPPRSDELIMKILKTGTFADIDS
ncbi:unnamed protein product [Nezara viridula]|uniref:Uncharacterized protein n=1 Tax=Nezara viridula TaxID=85310 RepID=A0A9P0ECT7_NEZVI|nr:unnamed protein product [Nezara viridula]